MASRFTTGRILLAVFFVITGCMHFVFPDAYIRIVPPALPARWLLVVVSGIAEIAGGLGLLWPATQRPAAWGLMLLLCAVFPANVYMAIAHVPFPGLLGNSWIQWLRLPLQIPLIVWAFRCTRESHERRAQ